jgi:2-oxoglutarate dehydrogenase E1 component
MTPKKLLRSEDALSKREDFTKGHFQEILLGPTPTDAHSVERLIFCSGKVYYDLLAYQKSEGWEDRALLVRVEQLYPLHQELLEQLLKPYLTKKTVLVWCQEEPENMGAYHFIVPYLEKLFHEQILYAGREAAASTAVGALSVHNLEQATLVKQAFEVVKV